MDILLFIALPFLAVMVLIYLMIRPMIVQQHVGEIRKGVRFGKKIKTSKSEEEQLAISTTQYILEINEHYRPQIVKLNKRIMRSKRRMNKARAHGKPEPSRAVKRFKKLRSQKMGLLKMRRSEIEMADKFLKSRVIDKKTGETKHGISRSHHGSRSALEHRLFKEKKDG